MIKIENFDDLPLFFSIILFCCTLVDLIKFLTF